MASVPEREAAEGRRGWLLELLGVPAVAPDRDAVLFPILVGLIGPSRGEDEGSSAVADRIIVLSPVTQGMMVLRGGRGGPDFGLAQDVLRADGDERGSPPASKASIEAMRAVERPIGEVDVVEECAVCLDDLWTAEEGESNKAAAVVKEMPCGHRFHEGCIGKWLGMHGLCPMCRYQMPEEKKPERKKEGEGGQEGRRLELESGVWVTLGFRSVAGLQLLQQQPQQERHPPQQNE